MNETDSHLDSIIAYANFPIIFLLSISTPVTECIPNIRFYRKFLVQCRLY